MDAALTSVVVRLRRESAIVVAAHALHDSSELPPTTMPLGRAIKRVACGHEDRAFARPAKVYFSDGVLEVSDCLELWNRLGSKLIDGIENVL